VVFAAFQLQSFFSGYAKRMTVYVNVPTLDEAFYFLNQAKGLPHTASSQPLNERYLRVCILLSWVAAEEALSDAIDDLKNSGKLTSGTKGGLADRLEYVLNAHGHGFLLSDFLKARRIRNKLAHARQSTPRPIQITVSEGDMVFEYCRKTIADLVTSGRRQFRAVIL
jgi:hypothetical protein